MMNSNLIYLTMGHETPMELIEKSVYNILLALGEDPSREGLLETPNRVARMFIEMTEGTRATNEGIALAFNKQFEVADSDDLVVVSDMQMFSMCEHHLALMYNMKVHVAYIPNGKVLGLSKIARIVDMVCKRFQLQERIGRDVADILGTILELENVAVVIEAEHACMAARGIKKPGTTTRTATMRGVFRTRAELRDELYSLIALGGNK